jgi:hypothetical protein
MMFGTRSPSLHTGRDETRDPSTVPFKKSSNNEILLQCAPGRTEVESETWTGGRARTVVRRRGSASLAELLVLLVTTSEGWSGCVEERRGWCGAQEQERELEPNGLSPPRRRSRH